MHSLNLEKEALECLCVQAEWLIAAGGGFQRPSISHVELPAASQVIGAQHTSHILTGLQMKA